FGGPRDTHSLPTRRSSDLPMLDLDRPGKPLKQPLQEALQAQTVQQRALASACRVIDQLKEELVSSAWFTPDYVHQVIAKAPKARSEEHTSELQSRENLVCR